MWKSTAALLSLLLVLALSVGLYRSLPERWEGTVLPREEELSLSVVREEPFSLEAFLAAPPVYEGEAAKVLNGRPGAGLPGAGDPAHRGAGPHRRGAALGLAHHPL